MKDPSLIQHKWTPLAPVRFAIYAAWPTETPAWIANGAAARAVNQKGDMRVEVRLEPGAESRRRATFEGTDLLGNIEPQIAEGATEGTLGTTPDGQTWTWDQYGIGPEPTS